MKKKMKKPYIHISILFAMTIILTTSFPVSARTRAEADRSKELIAQGYSISVAQDQAAEEYGTYYKGNSGTGGIDGIEPNGSIAPYNELGLTATPAKPSCTHDWVETDKVEPTCQTEGKIEYTCSKCNKTKTETLKKVEHDYVLSENKVGNCQEKATQTFTCSGCGDTYTVDGELGEHLYVKGVDSKEPTCTEKGLYTYTCSICADTYTEEIMH